MTDKEFKRLKRADLIDIIYQLQNELEETNKQLEDRKIKIETAGSIADAAVAVNQLMEIAQQTADQYVESVKQSADEEKARIIEAAKAEAARIAEEAKVKIAGTTEQSETSEENTEKKEGEE